MISYENPDSQDSLSSISIKDEELFESDLINLTYAGNANQIQEYLKKHSYLDITLVRNTNNFTILHLACMNNQLSLCKIFFSFLRDRKISLKEIRKWVNTKTKLGQTAMHFASLHGNLPLIKLLERYDASIYTKDNNGRNMIHFAAQGDQPISIVYFNIRGLSIHEKDSKGRTPLHLASIEGVVNSVYYLSTRESLLNTQDYEKKYTPLHYAVLSGNIKIVRRLLMKGSSPNVKDYQGFTPLELAKRTNNFLLAKLLQKRSTFKIFLGLQENLSPKKTKLNFIVFCFVYLILVASNFLFVFPFTQNNFWVISSGIFAVLTLLSFLCSWLANPGYIRNTQDADIISLLQAFDPQQICPDCIIVRPLRSKHCESCKKCISVCDHHCTWINNCVGAKNHKYFLCFIILSLISIIFLFTMEVLHYWIDSSLFLYIPNFTNINIEDLKTIKNFVCIFSGIIALIFVFPLLMLNYVQIGNFIQGKTSYERYGYQSQGTKTASKDLVKRLLENEKEEVQETKKKRFKDYVENCINMCFRNASNPKYNSSRSVNHHL